MAESHKFKNLSEATAVFPDLNWQGNADGESFVWDEKQEKYVPVTEGQYIISIGDRFEVADEEPAKAKPAEAPKAEAKSSDKADK